MAEQQFSVFISYARADDEPFVDRLQGDLTKADVRVWWDREAMESRGHTFLQEIQDAIEGVDRVIAVVGPRALESEYVRYEWGHAQLFAKVIVPVLRLGEYQDVPTELVPDAEGGLARADLGDFHCLDFREGRSYDHALDDLLRVLEADLPALAEIGETPRLPRHFVPRRDELRRIQRVVLADVHRPTVVSTADQIVALQGMGGTGKSVLAAAFVRMIDTRRAFEDGITWLTAGERADESNLLDNVKRLWITFQGDLEGYADDVEARSRLSVMLAQRVGLIVLDDVWSPGQVEVIANALGPRCRMLITTRDEEIAAGLARHLPLDVFSEDESLSLLAEWSQQPREELPQEAWEVARECGNLPLTLAMVGAMVRGHPDRWGNALHKLRTADLEKLKRQFPNYPYPNLLRAIDVSVEVLDPVDRARYLDLAVFPRQTPISESALRILWEPVGLGPFDIQDLIDLLIRRSLVRQDFEGRVTLHALQADYVSAQAEDLALLHRRMLDAYDAACPDGWPTGPNDGYFFENLAHHLVEAGFTNDLLHLLVDGPDWMNAKATALGSDASLAADVERLLALMPADVDLIRLHAVRQVVRERIGRLTDTDLKTLLWRGRRASALAQARLRGDANARFQGLMALCEELDAMGEPDPRLLEEVEVHARGIGSGEARAEAFVRLGTLRRSLDDERWSSNFDEAREVADAAEKGSTQWRALLGLAMALRAVDGIRARSALDAACASAKQLTENYDQADALRAVALEYGRCGLPQLALETLETHPRGHSGMDSAIADILIHAYRAGALSSSATERARQLVAERAYAEEDNLVISASIAALTGDRPRYDASMASLDESLFRSSYARRCLIATLVEAGDFEGARREASAEELGNEYADALCDIVRSERAAAGAEIDEEPLDLTDYGLKRLNDTDRRYFPTIRIGRLLVLTGRADKALDLVRRENDMGRSLALSRLLPELDRIEATERGRFLDGAEAIIREMKVEGWREPALRALALAMAKARDSRADTILQEAWTVVSAQATLYQRVNVLMAVVDVLAVAGYIEPCIQVIRAITDERGRVDGLCGLANWLHDRGDTRHVKVLEEARRSVASIRDNRERLMAQITVVGALGHANDRRCEPLADEVAAAARHLEVHELSKILDTFGEETWRTRAGVLDALVGCLLSLGRTGPAATIADGIPDRNIRARRFAQIAAQLARAGGSGADAMFSTVKKFLTDRGELPGVEATNLRTLIFCLADAGRLEEAVETARIEFREEDRSRTLAAFTGILIEAGRLDDAWEFAHSTVAPIPRAQALVRLAVAEAERAPETSRALFEEVREVARSDERPDRKASVQHELVRGLLALGRIEEATAAAATIPLHSFRADAFRVLAEDLAEEEPQRANHLLERAHREGMAIPDQDERRDILRDIAGTTAQMHSVRRGLEMLETASFDDFIGTLADWAPLLEKTSRELPASALREAIAIASWVRPDWKDIDRRIRESDP